MSRATQTNTGAWRLAAPVGLVLGLLSLPAVSLEVPELDCVIEPHMVIDLSSRTDGIVETIEVERGDVVEVGQVVVQLEASVERAAAEYARAAAEAEADLHAGQVSMGFAQRRRERLESLYLEKVLSSDQMDEMETEAKLSKLELDQARERRQLATLELRRALEVLERHTLRSPIDGVVVQRFLAPGESVEEKPVLRLAQIDPLRVEVIVPVSYFGAIEIGQQAVVYPERPSQNEYTADVTIVDRVADAASGTFRVRLSLPNPDYSLPSGLNCLVRFLPKPVNAPVLARSTPPAPPASKAGTIPPARESTLPTLVPHAGLAMGDAQFEEMSVRPQALDEKSESSVLASTSGKVARIPALSPAGKTNAACQTVGPIIDVARADALKAALAGRMDSVAVRKESTPISQGFIIVSPPQGSVPEAKSLAEKMKAGGLTDMYVFGRGPYKGRVSLGIYNKKSWAEERVGEIQSAGFAAEALTRRREVTRYWVDVAGGSDITASRAGLPDDVRELLGDLSVAPTECASMFAAGR